VCKVSWQNERVTGRIAREKKRKEVLVSGFEKKKGGVLLVQARIIGIEGEKVEGDEGRYWDREKPVGSWEPHNDQILDGGSKACHVL